MLDVLIVGAGGIGSWLCRDLSNAIDTAQFGRKDLIRVTVADDDQIEDKNLRYQDFTEEDLYDNKSEVMADRYGFVAHPERIENLTGYGTYGLILCCVDNTRFRRELFNQFVTGGPFWIDLRSEGATVAAFTKHKQNSLDKLLATLPEEIEEGSCQRAEDLANNTIQYGNRIIASIGAQFALNWHRKAANPPKFIHNF